MAKGVTELLMKIRGDNKDAVKKLEEIDKKLGKTGDNFMKAAKTMAAAFVASKIGAFGKDAIDAALRAEEAANKFKVVFGPAVEDAGKFVDDYATRLGMSTGQLTGLMGSIGSVVSGMGAASSDLAGMSTDIAILGADLASFHDKGVEQAIGSIISALTGERESLKTSFGIVIKEADVVKRALIDTGKDSAKELTELDKIMATMALITIKAELQGAIGDLDRTMDDNVAKIRDLSGQWEQFKEDVGTIILPIFGELVTVIGNATDVIKGLADAFVEARDRIKGPVEDIRNDAAKLANEAPGLLGTFGTFVTGVSEGLLYVVDEFTTFGGAVRETQGAVSEDVERMALDLTGSFAEMDDAVVNSAIVAGREAYQMARDFSDNFAEIDQATVNNQIAFDLWEAELANTLTETVTLFDGAADEIEISVEEMMVSIAEKLEQNDRFKAAIADLASDFGVDGDLVKAVEDAGPGMTTAAEELFGTIEAAVLNLTLGEQTTAELALVNAAIANNTGEMTQETRDLMTTAGYAFNEELGKWVTATDARMNEVELGIRDSTGGMQSAADGASGAVYNSWWRNMGRTRDISAERVEEIRANIMSLNGIYTSSTHTSTVINRVINESVYRNTGGGAEVGYQHGGVTPGGSVLVGEAGPELVDLPKGSRVHTATATRQRTNGPNLTINVAGNVVTERDLVEAVRRGLDENAHRNGTTGII